MDYTHRLLISLDCLLDTRAGTLTLMDLNKSAKLMNDLRYCYRVVDWFEGFDKEVFKQEYKRRNAKTLSVSLMTRAYKIISDFLLKAQQRNLDSPHQLSTEVHVNFAPFLLSPETEELILNALRVKIPQITTLRAVHLQDWQMTPALLKENYGTVVLYNFLEWIEVHSENEAIKKCPIPGVAFFTPALVERFDEKFPKDVESFFVDAMTLFQPFASVVFLPVDVFCSVLSITNKPSSPKATGSLDEVPESKGFDLHW